MSDKEPQKVHTDALETLGYKISEKEARDAIHLAVEPAIAYELLKPGQHVGLMAYKHGATTDHRIVVAGDSEDPVGIVDPFLKEMVAPGEMFWLVVYPRQIKSLRHVWEHPAFPNSTGLTPKPAQDQKIAAVMWIDSYAACLSGNEYGDGSEYYEVTAEELIETAKTWCGEGNDWGEFLVKGGLLEGTQVAPEFWKHFEILTGMKPNGGKGTNFFSCSC